MLILSSIICKVKFNKMCKNISGRVDLQNANKTYKRTDFMLVIITLIERKQTS